jgi:Domain of unknown function (DUF4276)
MKHPPKKIKIGIVGEDPNNDALALSHLLRTVVLEGVQFAVMQKNIRGSQLDSVKFLKTLKAEFKAEQPKHIIFVRDLDALLSDSSQVSTRDAWFARANEQVQNCGIFFLAIYEMEALILADIDNLNKYYRLKIKDINHPMAIEKPKEVLQKLTENTQKGRYRENDAPKIFQALAFETVYKHHKGTRSFQYFADELSQKHLIQIAK